jgi:3-hydroxybutyryl-CoA dehydratase
MQFEEISVGDSIPALQKQITQEVINCWAEVSTDYNPLHVDPEFAKKTRFGGTIAHGHIALSFLCEMMHRWLGPGWIAGGKLEGIKFIAPIRPGHTISIGGTITEKRVEAGKNIVQAEIFVENQDGEKCVVGSAQGIVVG